MPAAIPWALNCWLFPDVCARGEVGISLVTKLLPGCTDLLMLPLAHRFCADMAQNWLVVMPLRQIEKVKQVVPTLFLLDPLSMLQERNHAASGDGQRASRYLLFPCLLRVGRSTFSR